MNTSGVSKKYANTSGFPNTDHPPILLRLLRFHFADSMLADNVTASAMTCELKQMSVYDPSTTSASMARRQADTICHTEHVYLILPSHR
jgi:hypothetical protein